MNEKILKRVYISPNQWIDYLPEIDMSEKTIAEQFEHYKKIWRHIDHDELVPHPEIENMSLNGTGRNMYVEELFLKAVPKVG
jgi:hypothetical protein